jgi:unsaturated chondroitin disaccharide hydrolase
MPIQIDYQLTPSQLLPRIERLFELSAAKILSLERTWKPAHGTPVFTVKGKYTTRGWTEWTQGFQFGSALLQFDATEDKRFLNLGRRKTLELMAPHLTHTGVHDHGFNNISTYGTLLRMVREDRIQASAQEVGLYELALKVSGAVQAARWTELPDGGGFIYSFNGPHSLFVDTLRSLRVLAVAHQLGHVLMGEGDRKTSLLERLIAHALATVRYNIYFGGNRDAYDLRGRVAHESIFNLNDGSYRCPSTQQGYSPFSTWTRGLAWAILGLAEQIEFLSTIPAIALKQAQSSRPETSKAAVIETLEKAALASADFYLEHACADGIPMWDTGAPNLHRLGDYAFEPANPYNEWEPVDSSAAAIAGQGLVRLGAYLSSRGQKKSAHTYRQAGLTVAGTLFAEPYLSTNARHQGLILHSVYHRPRAWDYVAPGQSVPNGESSMWGDFHARELALLLLREAKDQRPLLFFES